MRRWAVSGGSEGFAMPQAAPAAAPPLQGIASRAALERAAQVQRQQEAAAYERQALHLAQLDGRANQQLATSMQQQATTWQQRATA